ncbi:hypothetical protein QBC36DRAFT_324380 [Triangularia setosa]|uniref:Uncharacterized protein n=1 Tax=Triangularia setosa TaxID=2587417 RepID=A0AAN6WAY0_9PEZI|nr:hypothetical protein QBC36DRAFT_324380 [Podospora setosa]
MPLWAKAPSGSRTAPSPSSESESYYTDDESWSGEEYYHEDDQEDGQERRGPSSTRVQNGSIAPRGPKQGNFYGIPSGGKPQQQTSKEHGPRVVERDRIGERENSNDWQPEPARPRPTDRHHSSTKHRVAPPPSPPRPVWLQNLGRANSYISDSRRNVSRSGNYWDQADHEGQEQRNRSLVTVRPFSGARRKQPQEQPTAQPSRRQPLTDRTNQGSSEPQPSETPPAHQPRGESRKAQSRKDIRGPEPRPHPYEHVPVYLQDLSSTARETVSQNTEHSDTGDKDEVSQQASLNIYERPVDLVHDPSQSTKNMSVRLEFDVEEDWDTDLEEFCRFRRLGRFKDAQDYFDQNLERYSTIPYIRVQYAEMLISSGNFKLFRDLRLLPEFLPPVGEESLDELNRGKLAANYALLDLLSQRHFPDYVQTAWRIVENTLKALSAEQVMGSTEIQLLSLCLRVLYRLEICTHEGILDVAKIYAKYLFDWSRLYREIAAEDCIWDVRDLLVASTSVFGWHDTSTMFFGTSYLPKIMDLISNDWIRPNYDEPSTLGLLDLFTSLILQDHGKEMAVRNHLLLEYATLFARSIRDHDEGLMRSRPYLQWLLAKSVLEITAVPERPDGIRLKDFNGLEIRHKNGIHLPIYVPKDGSARPSWDMFFTRSTPTQRHTAEVAVATAEAIGDYTLKAEALKVLILLSQTPGRSMADLCRLQLEVQGDTEGYLATRLSSYLLLNEPNELDRLGTNPTDFNPSSNETCENATLRWAGVILPAQILLHHEIREGDDRPILQYEELSELMKTAFNMCRPKLPSYIIDFARQKLQLEAPPAIPMPMLALSNFKDDKSEADKPDNGAIMDIASNVDDIPRYNPFINGSSPGAGYQQQTGHPYRTYPALNANYPFLNPQDLSNQYPNYPIAYGQSQIPYTSNVTPYVGAYPWVQGPGPSNTTGAPNPFDYYTPPPPPPPPPSGPGTSPQDDRGDHPQKAPDGIWPNVEVAGWPPTWQQDAQRLANTRPPPSTEDEAETAKAKGDQSQAVGASPATADKVSQWLFPGSNGAPTKNDLNRQATTPPAVPAAPATTAPTAKNVAPENAVPASETKGSTSNEKPMPTVLEPNTTSTESDVSNANEGNPAPNTGIRRRHTVDVLPERNRNKMNRTVHFPDRGIPEENNTLGGPEAEHSGNGQGNSLNEKPSLSVEEGLPTLSFPPELLQGHKLTVILDNKEDPQKVKAYVIDGEGVHETPVVRPTAGEQHRSRTKIHVKSGSYEVADAESQSGGSTVKVNRSRSKDKGKARDTGQVSPGYQEEGAKEETARHGTVRPHVVLDDFINHPPHEKLPKPSRRNSGFGGPAVEGPSRRQSMSKSRPGKEEQDKLPKSASKRAKKAAQRFSALGPAPSPPPSPPPSGMSRPPPDEPLYASDANLDTGVISEDEVGAISENEMGVSDLDNDEEDYGHQDKDKNQDEKVQDQTQGQDRKQNQGQAPVQDQGHDQKQDREQGQSQNQEQKERQYYNQDPDQQQKEELGEGIRVYASDSIKDTTPTPATEPSAPSPPSHVTRTRVNNLHDHENTGEDWEIHSIDGDEGVAAGEGQSPEAVIEILSDEDEDENEDEEAARKEVEQMLNDMQTARKRRQEADRAEEEWLKGRLERLAAKGVEKETKEKGKGKAAEVVEEPESILSTTGGEETGEDTSPRSPLRSLKRKKRGIKRLAEFVKGASSG